MSILTPKPSKQLDADAALDKAIEGFLQKENTSFHPDHAVDPMLAAQLSIALSLREIAKKLK